MPDKLDKKGKLPMAYGSVGCAGNSPNREVFHRKSATQQQEESEESGKIRTESNINNHQPTADPFGSVGVLKGKIAMPTSFLRRFLISDF
ncbi:hypothetical protein X798_04335 [Onchocerca flexuosa]|uniref:Uncharacterized protein n=1 Tax=Onchocerca flexuosa TaxID=387005 RepID=A0A238BUI9_9BILA|nr:hypothetical protein X798_04335 [Onchocerca flexuosa]